MPRRCTVCTHPERSAIDALVVSGGASDREVARRYGVSAHAVGRHRARHLSPALAAVQAEREREGALSLLDRVENLIARVERILAVSEETGKVQAALSAVRELRGLLELMGKASGELNDRPQVTINLMASEEWLTLRAALFAALAPYPDARAAVSGQLLQLEAGDAP